MGLIDIPTPAGTIRMIDEGDRVVHHETHGGFERETIALWASVVKPGQLAIDVGAYTGIYAMIAAKAGAQAIAIEPHPSNWERMRANTELNGLHISMVFAACAAKEGSGMLRFNPKVRLTSGGTLKDGGSWLGLRGMPVRTVTVDAVASGRKVAAIKIDVEGFEESVILGAMGVVCRDRPVLIIETLTEAACEAVSRLLPDHEMTKRLDGRNAVFMPREH